MTSLRPVSLRVWMLHIITKGTAFTRQGSYKVQVKVMIIFFRETNAKTIGGAGLITLLMIPFFLILLAIFGIIYDLMTSKGRKECARTVSLFILNILTIGICLLDLPMESKPHSGIGFILFYALAFTPLMIVFSLYTLYRIGKHYRYFKSKFAIILRFNASLLFLLSLVNLFVLWRIFKTYRRNDITLLYFILIVLGIGSTFQLIVGELEKKRIRILQKQEELDSYEK